MELWSYLDGTWHQCCGAPSNTLHWHSGELWNYRYTLGARELWQMGLWSYLDGNWHQCCGAQTHCIWHLGNCGTTDTLSARIRHTGTWLWWAVELSQTHWKALVPGEMWSYPKHTEWYLVRSTLYTRGDTRNTTQYIVQDSKVQYSIAHNIA